MTLKATLETMQRIADDEATRRGHAPERIGMHTLIAKFVAFAEPVYYVGPSRVSVFAALERDKQLSDCTDWRYHDGNGFTESSSAAAHLTCGNEIVGKQAIIVPYA